MSDRPSYFTPMNVPDKPTESPPRMEPLPAGVDRNQSTNHSTSLAQQQQIPESQTQQDCGWGSPMNAESFTSSTTRTSKPRAAASFTFTPMVPASVKRKSKADKTAGKGGSDKLKNASAETNSSAQTSQTSQAQDSSQTAESVHFKPKDEEATNNLKRLLFS